MRIHMKFKKPAACGNPHAQSAGPALFALMRDRDGGVALEAAVVLPVLLVLALGILQFGIIMNIYMTATAAAAAGLQTFSVMRGISGSYNATVTAAKNAAQLAAWRVSATDVTVSVYVNGTACATDTSCDLALTNAAPPSTGGAGGTTKVGVTVACTGLRFLHSLPSMCPITTEIQGIVQ